MAKYKYEKFKIGSKFYLLSQHDGDRWAGPAIKYNSKSGVTSIGLYTDNQQFSFEIDIHKKEGNEYVIRMNNKEGNPNGPVIVLTDDSLYFGPYFANYGFHGIVYKLRFGENIVIQNYKYGILVDACLTEHIFYEDVKKYFPFDAWFEVDADDIVERKINNKNGKWIEYIVGDPTSHLTCLAALIKDNGDITIGQYSNNAFNGLAFDYSVENDSYFLSFYDNGEETGDYFFNYLEKDGEYLFVFKNSGVENKSIKYIALEYKKESKGCKFQINYLDENIEEVKEPIVLPDYIDSSAPKAWGIGISKHLPAKDLSGFTAQERLNNLIGLSNVKKELNLLKALYNKNPDGNMSLNMCFYGNPGTGKTEVARLLAEILYDEGILKENKLVETDPSGLIAEYVGQTQPKTHKKFREALNGVLFIDEAYNLVSSGYKGEKGNFGAEAISALLQDMETYRGQICVIFAGYRKPMEDMIASNPGFASRINRKIDFPDYTKEELARITELIIEKKKYSADNKVVEEVAKIVYANNFLESYANARDVRNVVEKLTEYQALRTTNEKSNKTITMDDIYAYLEKKPEDLEDGKRAEDRLNELIGLENVKNELAKMIALLEKQKGDLGQTNLHMCFYGNPGTGKTEVANLIANIFYDKGILPTNKFVSTDASGLIAAYVGQTQAKTHKIIKDSLNGVLFIDEAYALAQSEFGKEAIAALLQDMDNYRGKFCVILAGYKDEIENMISLNPGFDSRINRKIVFPNYTTNELLQISQLMLDNKHYTIEDDAKTEVGKVLLNIKETAKANNKPFANAREVRNLLESLYEIQALRTSGNFDDFEIKLQDVKEYEEDHNISLNKEKSKKHKFDIDYRIIKEYSYEAKEASEYEINDYIKKATVNIKVETKSGTSEGTGFFITKNGIIATCAHVVSNAEKITIIVNYKTDKDEYITKDYAAEVITLNENDDTALIGILSNNIHVNFFPLKPAELGFPKELSTKIIMGGYPFGANRFANITYNKGYVQSVNRDNYDNENTWIYVDLLGLPGNSGSGVLNEKTGQIEGIFAGVSINPSDHSQTIKRIIPVQYLWKLIKEVCNKSMNDYLEIDDNESNIDEKMEERMPNHGFERSINKYFEDRRDTEFIIGSKPITNIKIVRGDITTYTGDAIVNAANKYLAPGYGVCGAIFRAAGYKELDAACKMKGEQQVGSAILTSGFNLSANYIIHAVGPRYDFDRNPERLLEEVYKNTFEVAKKNNIKSIAFPSISTGIYHFPINLACPIALREMMNNSSEMDEIVVYCFDEVTYNTYIETFRRLSGIR